MNEQPKAPETRPQSMIRLISERDEAIELLDRWRRMGGMGLLDEVNALCQKHGKMPTTYPEGIKGQP
jgi:hypothetical protein